MNKIEEIKSEKDPLAIRSEIVRFAKEGWDSIGEGDEQRLKWYGLFLRKPTPGFFMIRVRIPNGIATAQQIKMLAYLAQHFGNGIIDITTRQQIQLRHFKIEDILEVFDLMDMVGLTSLQTGMDNVRNIMGCPVAGLNPREILDASPFVTELNQLIQGNPEFTNLPRKFNVAITGCPDNCVHAETQDLALVPALRNLNGEQVAGFNVRVGGKLGSGGYRIASCMDTFVPPEDVVEVCSAIIKVYRDYGSREIRTQNRLAFLIDEWGVKCFREKVTERIGRSLLSKGEDARGKEIHEHIGVYRQKNHPFNYVGLKVIVGRIKADQLKGVAELSETYGTGEIRFSPAQSIIITHVPDERLGDLLDEPILKELHYAPSPLMKSLVSCVGSDYCALATIETKSRAVQVASKLEDLLDKVEPISMHWSGCAAACGNHLVADIGLLGKRTRVRGEVVDAVDVFVGGRAGPYAKEAIKVLENVPCDQLPQVLKMIVPYHARKKIHPMVTRRGARKKPANQKSPDTSAVPAQEPLA